MGILSDTWLFDFRLDVSWSLCDRMVTRLRWREQGDQFNYWIRGVLDKVEIVNYIHIIKCELYLTTSIFFRIIRRLHDFISISNKHRKGGGARLEV